tara:strand:- start:56 stop:1561 length:1506 start_codon:yes stop_codon:yes gene_type:complete
MGSQHPDQYDFAGDYNLNGIVLQNHAGTGGRFGEGGVNIQSLVQELNIYEGIDQTSVYGTLVMVDSMNLISNLPIQGTERLFFKLSTPGTSKSEHIVDASEETGHPFYVYKISNKQQPSQGTLVYTIHFASREFLRNIRTKVSQAYSGKLSDMVQQIIGDKQGLDSRKTLHYEETKNSDKIVIPNLAPFKAISLIAKRALPKFSEGVGYYFYETTKGFYFQSWENMCAFHLDERDPIQTYYYQPQNISEPDPETGDQIVQDLKQVEEYRFINTFHDTAACQALGTYGHRVISYNLFSKAFKTTDYHYHNQFNETVHADYTYDTGLQGVEPQIRSNPVDFDIKEDGTGKGVSDYAESLVSLQPTTQYLHDEETGSYGTDVSDDGRLIGIRNSKKQQVTAGTTIEMTVKGQTQIQPGQVIDFELRPVETDGATADKKNYDPQYSGRYIITKVRHRVTKQDYKMVFECKKDSVREGLLGEKISNFTGTANSENAQYKQLNKFSI